MQEELQATQVLLTFSPNYPSLHVATHLEAFKKFVLQEVHPVAD